MARHAFFEFDRLAIAEDRETAIDIELRHDRSKADLDFMGRIPTLLETGQLLNGGRFIAQKLLGQHPALVRVKGFVTDQSNRALFVELTNAFADTAAANAAANNEIVALNHL
jgi:hypothetical protein